MADVDVDLQAVHDAMVSAAYEAGKMILAANPADIDTGTKLNCMFRSGGDSPRRRWMR